MKFLIAKRVSALLAVICLLSITGCTPPPGTGTASPVDRYVESGQAQEKRNDYTGALAAYNKALALNMQNADVHHALAGLYDNELNAPEKALYHYLRVLEISPEYRWADIIKDRLPRLRMRVSSGTIPMVPCSELEQQIVDLHKTLAQKNELLEQQANQNKDLQQRVVQLNSGQNQPAPTRVTQRSSEPLTPTRTQQPPERVTTRTPQPSQQSQPKLVYTPPTQIRHIIAKGDTLYSLGRRYNLKVADIVRANPGLRPNEIKVGQVVIIPTR